MKKAFKIIIPILLAFVIMGSIAWYLLVYDTGFTQDLLLNQARRFEENGNHAAAVWVYNLAYSHSGEDGNVAIELANQYKGIGNYTKAEYTLSKAIADSASTELYVELCKTYVEQDKLLDAVRMLDSIADPDIKAELDAMRPVAPTLEPVPGFFNEYVKLDIDWGEGTLYVTTDGEYPSTENQPYNEVITLPAGETTVYALAVADTGLVSPVTIGTYTVVGVIEPIIFQDSAIEAQVRQMLNFSSETVVYTSDLWTLTSFTVPRNASTLADLARMNYLTNLVCANVTVDSLQHLTTLTLLQSIDFSGSTIAAGELSHLGSLPDLKTLKLSGCRLSTISALKGCTSLTELHLDNNAIKNLTPLSALVTLKELYLQRNAIVDLTALQSLSNLQRLDVSYNSIAATAPAASLKNLNWLDISNNQLTTVAGLDKLTNLSYLNVSANKLTDVKVLAGCVNLTELYLGNNSIADILALKSLTKLKTLDFSHNQVTTIPSWSTSCALYSINGSHNKIGSLTALKGMENLAYVYMDYNAITSVEPLTNCPNLVRVDVYGNTVGSVEALTKQSIIVNFDPTA